MACSKSPSSTLTLSLLAHIQSTQAGTGPPCPSRITTDGAKTATSTAITMIPSTIVIHRPAISISWHRVRLKEALWRVRLCSIQARP
ncbi:hypothetical protein AOQ84DRAFT_47531 [Glonium stellatum]|uniref:Secreted protein n=1 Tax=Glonium stellatum TaxID=574774 RepID=A0A8E2F030_9PEZI|nr:hypothetical protein AOQ84DRAFT_47531 [Glonium stellatum]